MFKQILGIQALTLIAALGVGCGSDNDADNGNLDARIVAIDTNGDLVVSVTEWNAAFAVLDDDKNGQLTLAEFGFNGTAFARVDVNADGVVSVSEWNAAFAVLDINNDQLIEAGEFDPFL